MDNYSIQITNYLKTQSLQIAVLVVVIAVITFVLKNRSAHVRYLLWLIVLAKCLVPPFLTVPLALLPKPQMMIVLPTTQPITVKSVETSAEESPVSPAPVIIKHKSRLTLRQRYVIGWSMGVVIFVAMAILKALRTELWLRRERKPLSAELQNEIKGLFSSLGLRISPKFWLVKGVGQPFVWGLLRGGIYLPMDFVKANNTEYRRGVLGHELSHVLRFDAAVNLLQIASQAVFWFHPFVWWANTKIRSEREKCCDEMAIARLGARAQEYSDAIVNVLISERESSRSVPSLAVAGSVKSIEERIKTMLRPGKKFYKQPSLPVAVIVVFVTLLTVPTTVVLTARADEALIATNPTNLGPTVNSEATAWDPDISADGLSLYFLSRRPGGLGSADIWMTTRKTKEESWSAPLNLGSVVNTSEFEGAPCLSTDGLEMYFVSDRPGGFGSLDIWITTRKSKDSPWGTPVNLGPKINTGAAENGPSISANGLELYFSDAIWSNPPARPGGLGKADIWVTTRKTKSDPWGIPVNLGPKVNGPYSDSAPSISADGLSLYFHSNRPGFGSIDIWAATRKTKNDPWGVPANLGPRVNTSHAEYNPDISSDGSTLYFASNRPGSVGGNMDIWRVSLNIEAKPAKSLHQAAAEGDVEQVRLHISNGADINAKDRGGRTPLYLAILHNKTKTVEVLLSHGADVHCTPEKGFYPLDHAAMFENLDMARMLINRGAKCNTRNYLGWTPLRYAVYYGNKEMLELFVANGADVSGIHRAASLGDVNRVRTLLQEDSDVDARDELGWTPLHWAALMGREEVGRVLLSKGARIEAENNYGFTPLNIVAYGGNLRGAEFLIGNGANVSTRAQNGFTPLHSAAYQGHREIVELLLTHGADKALKDRRGRTAMTLATNRGHSEIIELLKHETQLPPAEADSFDGIRHSAD
ncbi:MAG: ankyrin repeat domain-containing protein [Sedimentisphaerales bacterium]